MSGSSKSLILCYTGSPKVYKMGGQLVSLHPVYIQANHCSKELTFLFNMKSDGKPRNLGRGNVTVMCNVSVHFGMVL